MLLVSEKDAHSIFCLTRLAICYCHAEQTAEFHAVGPWHLKVRRVVHVIFQRIFLRIMDRPADY